MNYSDSSISDISVAGVTPIDTHHRAKMFEKTYKKKKRRNIKPNKKAVVAVAKEVEDSVTKQENIIINRLIRENRFDEAEVLVQRNQQRVRSDLNTTNPA